jgi:hypothetical protein
MYAWIIEADIHRLKKALFETTAEGERSRIIALLEHKRRLLAQSRGAAA